MQAAPALGFSAIGVQLAIVRVCRGVVEVSHGDALEIFFASRLTLNGGCGKIQFVGTGAPGQ